MVDNKLEITLELIDKATAQLRKATKSMEKQNKKVKKSFVDLAAKVYLFQKAIMALSRVLKVFVDAASKVEQFKIKLEVLLGTVEEGNKVFEDMAEIAGQVPKTYDEIMSGATALAGVVKGGSEEIKKLMPIIVDLSAGTGIAVQEVTGQMIRMYSAGAASADMFRERGVSAALGFQAGVSYSAEETMKTIISQWEDGTSKFAGAADALRDTWEGRVSMMQDAWFKFASAIGEWITKNPEVLSMFDNLVYALNYYAEGAKNAAAETKEYASALEEDLYTRLQAMNEEIVRLSSELRGWQFSTQSHAEVEEQLIELLEKKARILNSINKIRDEGGKIEQKLHDVEDAHIRTWLKVKEKSEKDRVAIEKKAWTQSISILEKAGEQFKAFAILARTVSFGKAIISAHEASAKALAAFADNPPLAVTMSKLMLGLGYAEAAMIAATPLAEGGIVKAKPGGILAQIGEGGKDEAVIPLDDESPLGGINIGTIIINGSVDGDNIEELTEQIGFEIERELRYSRSI